MAFIKNTDLLVEGSNNVFFTGDRARQEAVENSIASGVTNKAPSQAAVQSALDLKLDSSQVGASGGVASLGEDGKIPSSQLPALALTDVHVVADNTERDALTVQEGDVAIVTGTGKTWIYDGSAWQELTAAGAVISVNGETGAVSLDSDDVPEGSSNLYFADALAQGAVVVDSSSGTETNKSMSVSAAKAYSESQASAASGAALSAAESYTDIAVSGLASESYVDTQDQAASGYAYSQSQSYTDAASGALATEDLSFYKLDGSRPLTGDLSMATGQSIDVNNQSFIQMLSAGATVGIKFNRGQILPLQTLTSSGAASTSAQVVVADANSGAVTVTLPNVTGIAGRVYHVKGVNNGTNAVTVQGFSGQPVDGASGGFELSVQNESITVVAGTSAGVGWYIL